MNENNILTFLSFVGALVLAFWACIGFAFHMRWGTTGLAYLWRHRERLDKFVEKDIRERSKRGFIARTLETVEHAGR